MAFLMEQRVDLMRPNPVLFWDEPMEYSDAEAHVWRVSVVRGGETEDLTGWTAVMHITRAAGEAELEQGICSVRIDQSAAVDAAAGVIEASLSQACYMGVGAVSGRMEISRDGSVVTVARMAANLVRSEADAAYDPEGIVPTDEALAAQVRANTNAIAALQAAGGGGDVVSPEITVTEITGGHRITITDVNGTQSFDVMDGTGSGGSVTINGVTASTFTLDAASVGAVPESRVDQDLTTTSSVTFNTVTANKIVGAVYA